jgi:DNA-binding transcriptional LysR family regulator
MDLDLRLVRYFVTVAEERSFTEAGVRLHVSQPGLSQQVRKLERLLGVELFDRSGHRVSLTRAGRALFDEGRLLLAASERAVTATRRAGTGDASLRVAFVAGTPTSITSEVLRAAATDLPGVEVKLMRIEWSEQVACLREGRVDLAIVQLPLSAEDLHVRPLWVEPRVAVFPAGHRLATEHSISIEDVAEETILDARYNRDFWLVIPRPDGAPPVVSQASADTVEEMLELVAAGVGMCITTSSIGESHARRDLAFVPIDDIDPCVTAIARPRAGLRPDVEGFAVLLASRFAVRY